MSHSALSCPGIGVKMCCPGCNHSGTSVPQYETINNSPKLFISNSIYLKNAPELKAKKIQISQRFFFSFWGSYTSPLLLGAARLGKNIVIVTDRAFAYFKIIVSVITLDRTERR